MSAMLDCTEGYARSSVARQNRAKDMAAVSVMQTISRIVSATQVGVVQSAR